MSTEPSLKSIRQELSRDYGVSLPSKGEDAVLKMIQRHRQDSSVEALREAADEWGDGTEGFPHAWLHEWADKIKRGDDER